MSYAPSDIEPKWQRRWADAKAFHTSEDRTKKKFYALDMFLIPVVLACTWGMPIVTLRWMLFRGQNACRVFLYCTHSGSDVFGLPAEQNAISSGVHPAKITAQCIENFKNQLNLLGTDYDWTREVSTCDPNLLQVDSTNFPFAVRTWTRIPSRNSGELVSSTQNSSLKRRSCRWQKRTWWSPRVPRPHETMDVEDYAVRRTPSRWSRHHRLARSHKRNSTQLDRQIDSTHQICRRKQGK